jgi:hypothetical protein
VTFAGQASRRREVLGVVKSAVAVVAVVVELWVRVGAKYRRVPVREGIRAVGDGRGGELEDGEVRASAAFTNSSSAKIVAAESSDPFACRATGTRRCFFFLCGDEPRSLRRARRLECSFLWLLLAVNGLCPACHI